MNKLIFDSQNPGVPNEAPFSAGSFQLCHQHAQQELGNCLGTKPAEVRFSRLSVLFNLGEEIKKEESELL